MFYFLFLFLLGKISPGPNFLLSSSISIVYGFKKAIYVVFGILSGSILWSILVYNLIIYGEKFEIINVKLISVIGSIYLILIGIFSLIFQKNNNKAKEESIKNKSGIALFFISLVNCLLNPEIFLFYISIYKGYYQTCGNKDMFLLFVVIAMLITLCYFLLITYYISKLKPYIEKYNKVIFTISKIILIFIGVNLLLKL